MCPNISANPFVLTNSILNHARKPRRPSAAALLEMLEKRSLLSGAAPVAVADPNYTTNEDAPLNIAAAGVLANDTDAEADPLTAVMDSLTAHGALTLNPDGSFTYTPTANFNGTDSFTYHANDGSSSSNIATVTISVTAQPDAPVTTSDSYIGVEDIPINIAAPGVLANDTEADGQQLTAILVAGPSHGTLTLNPDGSFLYTPAGNFVGADSFTYQSNDGDSNGNIATVDISITDANDPPSATDDTATIDEDSTLTVSAPGVLDNDTDIDHNPLTAILVGSPSHGTLTLNADGSLTYTPNLNFSGVDSFTYKVSDTLLDSNIATVSITITPVNDAPTATNDTTTFAEDTNLAVEAPGVLDNDSDPDNNPLTAILVTNPSHGTLIFNPDGSLALIPTPNYSGPDSFTYKVSDGTLESNIAAVNITITAVNDVPTAADDTTSIDEDTTLTVSAPGVLDNDTDLDLNPLTAILVSSPAHGSLTLNADGSLSYTPTLNFTGTDSFTYKVNDATTDSDPATVTITVTPASDDPAGVNDSFSTNANTPLNIPAPGVLSNDTDPESDPLTAILNTGPTNGTLTLNANGSFTYTPNTGFTGADTFTYHPNDGINDGSVTTVTVTVSTSSNTPPVGVNDAFSTNKGVALTMPAPGVLSNDTDANSDALTATLNTGPTHGTLSLNSNGSFTYTPSAGFVGSDSFTYHPNDGSADGAIAIVNITVADTSTTPLAVNDTFAVAGNTPFTTPAPGVLSNDTDPENNPLTAELLTSPLNGTLTLNANGSFTYTPNIGFVGADLFIYRASDGTTQSTPAIVTLNVTTPTPPVNIPPTATDFTVTRNPGSTIDIDVLDHSADPNADPLGIVVTTDAEHGRAIVRRNETPFDFSDDFVLYIPDTDYFGPDSFTYTVNDNRGGTASATVTINVNQIGLSPNPFSRTKTDLIVLGTAASDIIRLATSPKGVRVTINGVSQGAFNPTGRIIVDGLAGNDNISAAGLNRAVELYGGVGNDVLTGSAKVSRLFGNSGNDILHAGTRRDLLIGGGGKNVLDV